MLRELKATSRINKNDEWLSFAEEFKMILKDAIELAVQYSTISAEEYAKKTLKIRKRFNSLMAGQYSDKDVIRIMKRLKRHRNEMFAFLEDPRVPFSNNESERNIRQMVIARKNSYCNRSEKSAETYAITCKRIQNARD